MRLDNLPKPETLWYEDQDGNKLDADAWQDKKEKDENTWYQHCLNACVRHSVYGSHRGGKWPVRFLKWITRKMPNSWHESGPLLFSGETTINCIYPIVKHLVENNGWHFSEACIAASKLCEDCLNDCLDECNGDSVPTRSGTSCSSCEYINLGRLERYRVNDCYRALNRGYNVADAWNGVYESNLTETYIPGYT